MKPHKRLMASLAGIAANRPQYEAAAFRSWLARQPGCVRRAPEAEQRRQFQAAIERATKTTNPGGVANNIPRGKQKMQIMKTNIGQAITLLNEVATPLPSHQQKINAAITLLKREDETRRPLMVLQPVGGNGGPANGPVFLESFMDGERRRLRAARIRYALALLWCLGCGLAGYLIGGNCK